MATILPFPTGGAVAPGPVATLPAAERLALNAFRLWVAAFRRREDPLPDLFALLRARDVAPEAAYSVDALFGAVSRAAQRPLDLRCPACGAVSPDEAVLLAAAGLVQSGDANLAEAVLRPLLGRVGASFVLGPLDGLGGLLAAAGFRLRSRRAAGGAPDVVVGLRAWTPPVGLPH